MRESFYIPTTGATAQKIDSDVAMIGDNVVANKEEAGRDDPESEERNEDPQPSQEDRRDVQHCAPIPNADDDDDCRTTASPDATHDEYCLESAPSVDALALSCLLFTKEETIKALETELEQLKNQLSVQKPPDLTMDSNIKLVETVATWNKELLSKQGQELVLETQITIRDNAIRRLKEDLARANRHVSELEVKLEFHDFKFVSYENHLREEKVKLSSDPKSKSVAYTGKLVSDLEEIEKLYISAKQDFAHKLKHLQQECNEYRAKCEVMGKTRETAYLASQPYSPQILDMEESDDVGVPKTFMQRKIKLLETELKAQSELTSCLYTQVEELTASLLNKEKKQKQEMHAVMRRKAALESKITAMQQQWKAGSGGVLNKEFQSMEANMEELLSEISRLEARLRTKDRVISKLQEKVSETKLVEAAPLAEQSVEEMLADPIPVENLIIVCEPLPNEFVETQLDKLYSTSNDRLEDEPSI